VTLASRASASSLAILRRPTISLLTSTSRMPPATIASASLTFWQHTPTAPNATCRRAIAGHLWVLACGRSLAGVALTRAVMRSRFRSNASSSMIRAGVSTSSSAMPISAGIACSMAASSFAA
jgi:hypothetical protein